VGFEEYVEACVDAGVAGISYWTLHEVLLKAQGWSSERIRSRLRTAGLRVVCVEAIYGWANATSPAAAVEASRESIDIASAHGSPNLAAVVLEPDLRSMEATVANLAAVADRAAEVDVAICVEFLPWSGIPDITTCWDLLRRTGRPNVGVLLDSWHWLRQPGGPYGRHADTLASMPGDAIRVFQLCDAGPEPWDDPMAECLAARPLPGDGVVDHEHLFGLLRGISADPVVTPEVFNTGLARLGMGPMARRIVEASRSVLSGW
jgi:sugar phosphate isomerase/epimerase